ncbi:hypothetical protein HYV56_00125 [Candidatus Peregrinibacteria bacterium]|nr:hypothetical protein [Candidatus Peregrinibacteria bacterium]
MSLAAKYVLYQIIVQFIVKKKKTEAIVIIANMMPKIILTFTVRLLK